jgi:hypothetical protein
MVLLLTMWIRSTPFVLAVALCGCSFSANYGDAKNATAVFHRLMDGGEYAAIYGTATKGFQVSGTRDNLIGFLARVNRKMGKCGDATVAFGGYQATTSGTFVTITSSRVCASGTLGEQFVWLMAGGSVKLFGYNANNPLLLVD